MISIPPDRAERARQRWQTLIEELSHPDVELTRETWAPFCATFQQLKRLGHPFDPALIVLMKVLERQAIAQEDAAGDV